MGLTGNRTHYLRGDTRTDVELVFDNSQANVNLTPSICFKMIVFGIYLGQFEGAGNFYQIYDKI
jgi:hypothetical protein